MTECELSPLVHHYLLVDGFANGVVGVERHGVRSRGHLHTAGTACAYPEWSLNPHCASVAHKFVAGVTLRHVWQRLQLPTYTAGRFRVQNASIADRHLLH